MDERGPRTHHRALCLPWSVRDREPRWAGRKRRRSCPTHPRAQDESLIWPSWLIEIASPELPGNCGLRETHTRPTSLLCRVREKHQVQRGRLPALPECRCRPTDLASTLFLLESLRVRW